MRKARYTVIAWMSLVAAGALCNGTCAAQGAVARAAAPTVTATPGSAAPDTGDHPEIVDGIAARVEDDIITESEIRELAAFQRVVDRQAKPRTELITELAEQWIAQGEAGTAKFPRPSATDVDHAYAQLAMQFGGTKEFDARAAAEGLNEAAVRRMLEQQLYLSRFLDYRFRPAVQVDDAQVEAYYRDDFVPQVKASGQQVPPLENVEETIREVLMQREITKRATEWLDETRGHLQVEVLHPGSAQ
jgi:hypothetical protein